MRKKIDWTMSVIVLVAYALLWAVQWIMAYCAVPDWVPQAIRITRTVVLCLMYLIVLYNAWQWTGNWILRILFIGLTAFLIATALMSYVPAIYTFFTSNGIPPMC